MEFVEKLHIHIIMHMHINQLSHVLQGEVVQVFVVIFKTYTDGLVAEFSDLEHLYRT